jgi:hypothetical protein
LGAVRIVEFIVSGLFLWLLLTKEVLHHVWSGAEEQGQANQREQGTSASGADAIRVPHRPSHISPGGSDHSERVRTGGVGRFIVAACLNFVLWAGFLRGFQYDDEKQVLIRVGAPLACITLWLMGGVFFRALIAQRPLRMGLAILLCFVPIQVVWRLLKLSLMGY